MSKPPGDGQRPRTKTGSIARARVGALVRQVVEAHETLSLDSAKDRETLITALVEALVS